MVQKLGCSVDIPAYVMQDFCPNCDCMFSRHGADPTCARCKKNTRWNPRKQGTAQRQAVYFDMKDTYKCMFNSSVLLDELKFKRFEDEALAAGSIRDRELLNASDGTILHGARSEASRIQASTAVYLTKTTLNLKLVTRKEGNRMNPSPPTLALWR